MQYCKVRIVFGNITVTWFSPGNEVFVTEFCFVEAKITNQKHCVFIYMYVCMHALYVCVYEVVEACLYVRSDVCIHVFLYVCMYVRMYVCIDVCEYINIQMNLSNKQS
jgi:hypothetical protein